MLLIVAFPATAPQPLLPKHRVCACARARVPLVNNKRGTIDDARQTTDEERQTMEDERRTINNERPMTDDK